MIARCRRLAQHRQNRAGHQSEIRAERKRHHWLNIQQALGLVFIGPNSRGEVVLKRNTDQIRDRVLGLSGQRLVLGFLDCFLHCFLDCLRLYCGGLCCGGLCCGEKLQQGGADQGTQEASHMGKNNYC